MKIVCAVVAFAPVAQADDPAAKSGAVYLAPKDMKWGEAPPVLPKGAKLTVLHGDPMKAGSFTIRLKASGGYKIPPHFHTQDEQLTVISGTLVLRMGETMTDAHKLGAGAYHFLPGKMNHAAEFKGETIVQIHGEGPFDIQYLNPADSPTPKAARK
ncbi:MAG TPA: cupin domain-containing protein [Kofleriaceae bacterium]